MKTIDARSALIQGLMVVVPAVAAAQAAAQPGVTLRGEHLDIVTDFTWGYRVGVKQPLGAFKDGLSIHQISRSNWPAGNFGTPSHVLWVDERTGEHGLAQDVTDQSSPNVVNPGGQVAFDEQGHIWFVAGGRASDMPFDLYRSTEPYNPFEFERILDDFVTYAASTAPCISLEGDKVLLFWRHAGSSRFNEVAARVRRYDRTSGFGEYEFDQEVGAGAVHPVLGAIGIEQLWSRFDPRHNVHMYTWQWFDTLRHHFGSNPFVYSDDAGATWKRADGQVLPDLPLRYTDADATLVPDDNLIRRESLHWFVRDLGAAPDGTFWITLPQGNALGDGLWSLAFWRFASGAWSSQSLTGPMLAAKAHACGATQSGLVLAYAERDEPNRIWARASLDNGATWTEPRLVHEVEESAQTGDLEVSWISFNQPAHEYADDAARFYFAYNRVADGTQGRSYQNSIGWLKVTIDAACPADIDGDGDADIADYFAFLDLFAAGDPRADLTGDGTVDVADFFAYLDAFAAGC